MPGYAPLAVPVPPPSVCNAPRGRCGSVSHNQPNPLLQREKKRAAAKAKGTDSTNNGDDSDIDIGSDDSSDDSEADVRNNR